MYKTVLFYGQKTIWRKRQFYENGFFVKRHKRNYYESMEKKYQY